MYAKRLVLYSVLVLALLLSACTCSANNSDDTNYTAKNTEIILEPIEYTHAVYRINISAKCTLNNSVGNDWEFIYLMDGQKITNGHEITVPLGETVATKTITAMIKERDKIPDEAALDITIEIRGGEEKQRELTVTENGGCYNGNTAVWEITVSVQFIENIKEQL